MCSLAATSTLEAWFALPTDQAHQAPPFSLVEQGVAGLDREQPSELSTHRLAADIYWIAMQERALQAHKARRLAELDRRQDGAPREGATTLLEHDLHLTSSSAYAQLRSARMLEHLPATAAALRRGEINDQHLDVICRAMAAVPRTCLDPDSTERSLLDKARCSNPHALREHWLQLRYRSDQEAAEIDEAEQHDRRWLHLWRTSYGTYKIEGQLDPVNGGLLRTALTSLCSVRSKDDTRTPVQRRTDAIGELARRLLDSGTLPRVAGEKPHLSLVATVETLRLEPGSPLARLDWGPLVTGRTARRIAEDADLTPVVVNQKGDILHVGRRSRVVPTRMRKALNLRDGGCTAPGCPATPDECDPHHKKHVADGGLTKMDNLKLHCRTVHHPAVHPENARFRRRNLTVVQPGGP